MALQGVLGPAGICEHCPIMCRALWDLPESVILSHYVQGFVGPAGICNTVPLCAGLCGTCRNLRVLSLYVQGFVGPAGISPLVLSDGVRGRSFLQVTNEQSKIIKPIK
jgi:hypothetical protein